MGDEDQSIYRWRGADYKNVLRFEDDFKDSQKILLEQNYRSTQNVLEVAKAVINRNRNRTPKNLFTQRTGDELIHLTVQLMTAMRLIMWCVRFWSSSEKAYREAVLRLCIALMHNRACSRKLS